VRRLVASAFYAGTHRQRPVGVGCKSGPRVHERACMCTGSCVHARVPKLTDTHTHTHMTTSEQALTCTRVPCRSSRRASRTKAGLQTAALMASSKSLALCQPRQQVRMKPGCRTSTGLARMWPHKACVLMCSDCLNLCQFLCATGAPDVMQAHVHSGL